MFKCRKPKAGSFYLNIDFYIHSMMLRSFLILFLCVVFTACSSDDSVALNEWFKDQGFADSYKEGYEEIELSFKNSLSGVDTSGGYSGIGLIGSYAVLGKTNGVEQSLYFGLEVSDALSPVWKLRTDSIFYKDIYASKFPDSQKKINAEFCWSPEQSDSLWFDFSEEDCKPINFNWKAGVSQDTFSVLLPNEFLDLRRVASPNTLKLLAGIKLITDNIILRIAPPSIKDIPGLRRVAQKTKISDECNEKCLHAGVRESLSVVFEISEDNKKKIAGKTVIFAQLVLLGQNDTTGSELGYPVAVNVYSGAFFENYRVDTAFVTAYGGHPNLVFWDKADSLKLQVTESLRRYAMAESPPDTLNFGLKLSVPMLEPKSLYFYNLLYSSKKVFSDRFAFARYDFSTAFDKPVKLRLWFADFDNKK
jgi:hypothetical protein